MGPRLYAPRRSMDARHQKQIRELLLSLFDSSGLRRFLLDELNASEELMASIQQPPATKIEIVGSTVEQLARYGFIDPEFFQRLAEARPRRCDEIAQVANTCEFPLSGDPPRKEKNYRRPTWDLYITYINADRGRVDDLTTDLRTLGLTVFLDTWELGASATRSRRLDDNARKLHNGLLVLSSNTLLSPWLVDEFAAMMDTALEHGRRLIPVVMGDVEIPERLCARDQVELRTTTGDAYQAAIYGLVRTVRGVELELVVESLRQHTTLTAADLPMVIDGKYKLEGQYVGHHLGVWVLLRDGFNRFYLQNPPVFFLPDGAFKASNIIVGPGIKWVHFVLVNTNGDHAFRERARRFEWGGFEVLPPGTKILESIRVHRK